MNYLLEISLYNYDSFLDLPKLQTLTLGFSFAKEMVANTTLSNFPVLESLSLGYNSFYQVDSFTISNNPYLKTITFLSSSSYGPCMKAKRITISSNLLWLVWLSKDLPNITSLSFSAYSFCYSETLMITSIKYSSTMIILDLPVLSSLIFNKYSFTTVDTFLLESHLLKIELIIRLSFIGVNWF